jgi:hypothetical protein
MSDGVEVITMDGRAVGAAQNATSPTVAYTRPPSAMETRQAPTPHPWACNARVGACAQTCAPAVPSPPFRGGSLGALLVKAISLGRACVMAAAQVVFGGLHRGTTQHTRRVDASRGKGFPRRFAVGRGISKKETHTSTDSRSKSTTLPGAVSDSVCGFIISAGRLRNSGDGCATHYHGESSRCKGSPQGRSPMIDHTPVVASSCRRSTRRNDRTALSGDRLR